MDEFADTGAVWRTKKRPRKRRGLLVIICLLICIAAIPIGLNRFQSGQGLNLSVSAANAYVVNMDTKSVLYQKASGEEIAPASTAKLVTALTILDCCNPDTAFTVGSEIELIAADSSRAWLNQGDRLTVRQLLAALLLPSGNDAAYTIAVNGGRLLESDEALTDQQALSVFMKAMNKKAKAVGASASHFQNPDGYDADGQYTTARDLAKIAEACLREDTLAGIMGRYSISDTWVSGRAVTYQNSNELLNPDSSYYLDGAIGLKTGSSGDAGACLISAATLGGQTYISVVMGSTEKARYTDSLKIYSAIVRL